MTTPFIEPDKVQSTFFESLNADEHKFYANIFAMLRNANRQWLAISLLRWRESDIHPVPNRNPAMQALFEAIIEAEEHTRFEEKLALLGSTHQSELDDKHVRLQHWFMEHFHFLHSENNNPQS